MNLMKSTLETALNEFGEKYHDFCNDHTCFTCPLGPDPHLPVPAFHNWRQQCKANVIDHLTEANKKMDEAIAKAEEAKRKKDEYAKKCSPEETASKLAALLPSYKAAYEAFVKVYAEVMSLKHRLNVAVANGYYDEYKIPEIPPVKLNEDAKKFRKEATE